MAAITNIPYYTRHESLQIATMISSTSIRTIFNCNLERAFKTPMLCDICKVHTGYGPMPRVTHCEEDASWGQTGGSRKIYMAKTIGFKGGEGATDYVLERIENQYWKIEITHFKFSALGFTKFQGEWTTTALSNNRTEVLYTYRLFSENRWLYSFHWLITKICWRIYMKHVLHNVKALAYSEAPYLHP